ncbi:MAG: Fic family protein [Hahellaceae bacterium]|nr:Fic family protein [Hahellaceae bacterium]
MTATFAMEPMIPSDATIDKSDLPDLALDLERKAAALNGMLKPITASVLEAHMLVMNSYYSNLIEGNSTHPREIRKAMQGNYDADPVKRDLQLESLAHINVQRQLSEMKIADDYLLSEQCFLDIHNLFYENIPDSLRKVTSDSGKELMVVPGQFRTADVQVGRHVPPAVDDISIFMKRYSEAYRLDRLRGQKRVIAAMSSHHRFVWIHPFLDGNGRVGRLYTDLFLKRIGIGACGVWCLSRGLARTNAEYKASLARADYPRQGDTDGRGALSESALVSFCEYMIKTAIDQVDYMTDVLDLQGMEKRIRAYVDDRGKGLIRGMGNLRPEAAKLLERAFLLGEFPRSEMEEISGLGLATARKLVQQLKEEGLLTETSSRSPLRWAIPEHAERYYLPELSPM